MDNLACWAKSVPLNCPCVLFNGIYLLNTAEVDCNTHKYVFIRV